MLPHARLKPGRGFKPHKAALYYLHRMTVAPRLRDAVTSSITTALNAKHGYEKIAQPSLAHTLETLQRDGIADLPDVPFDLVESLNQRLRGKNVIYRGREGTLSDAIAAGSPLAAYSMPSILSCPEIFQLGSDPSVLALANDYLGCRPTLSSIGLRWSFSGARASGDVQSFHRDLDDWLTLKYFIYLTDVSDDTGPHTYVKGSHKAPLEVKNRVHRLEEVQSRFGEDAVSSQTGNRGRAFIADMFGIHRGTVPKRSNRLILQFQYSILPVYAFEYAPQSIELPPGIDKYLFRLLVK